jgi:metal-sulfur cluster biosynthetic enzyme
MYTIPMVDKQLIELAMQKVVDPELHLDVWSLGLIYDIGIQDSKVKILMSLTSPVCPYGPQLIEDVRRNAAAVDGVKEIEVEITFSPPWGPERMSEEARIALGM